MAKLWPPYRPHIPIQNGVRYRMWFGSRVAGAPWQDARDARRHRPRCGRSARAALRRRRAARSSPSFISTRERRLIALERVSGSGPTRAALPLRAIFAAALRHDAAGLVIAHNHPSGDPAPSRADIEATRRLAETAAALGIRPPRSSDLRRRRMPQLPRAGPALGELVPGRPGCRAARAAGRAPRTGRNRIRCRAAARSG